jgi:hypothetical protein
MLNGDSFGLSDKENWSGSAAGRRHHGPAVGVHSPVTVPQALPVRIGVGGFYQTGRIPQGFLHLAGPLLYLRVEIEHAL